MVDENNQLHRKCVKPVQQFARDKRSRFAFWLSFYQILKLYRTLTVELSAEIVLPIVE